MDTTSQSDWQFLQCFGERTPGEDIQEGVALMQHDGANMHTEPHSDQQPMRPCYMLAKCCCFSRWRILEGGASEDMAECVYCMHLSAR